MNTVKFFGLFLNLIVYIILILPILLIISNKKIYKNKTRFTFIISCITIIEIILSLLIHIFSKNIFSIFSKTPGIINYAVYASKIIFITSTLYAIKFLIPAFLYNYKKSILTHKKTTILFLSKIVVNLLFIILGFIVFSTKGALYAFPICDFIYYLIYIVIFIRT